MNIKKFEIIFIVIFMSIISISFYVSGAEEEIYIENSKLDENKITMLDDSQEIVISDETRSKVSIKDLEEYIEKNYIDSKENLITARAAVPEGCLDFVNGDEVSGWAWRSSSPNDPINVKITLGNVTTGQEFIKEFSARYYREDLKNAGIGNGYHKFSYAIDWSDYPAGNYLVSAYAYIPNKDVELNNSYKFYFREPSAYLAAGIFKNSPNKEDNIDATKIINPAQKVYADMGFNVRTDINPDYNTLNAKGANNGKKLQSDIVLLSSHADYNHIDFLNGGLVCGESQKMLNIYNVEKNFLGTNQIKWENAKLVLLLGCKTGKEQTASYDVNLVDKIYDNRDDYHPNVVIGFRTTVREDDLEKWSSSFNKRLQEGKTVFVCVSNTLAQTYKDDNIKNIYFRGDLDLAFNNSIYTNVNSINTIKSSTSMNENEKEILINDNVKYKTEDDIVNVENILTTRFSSFNVNDYKVEINKAIINDDEYPVIDYKYRIGEFCTNSAYTIIIKDDKVWKVIDNTLPVNLENDEIENLKKIKVEENEKIEKFKDEAIEEAKKENNVFKILEKLQNVKLWYDLEENKKYVLIETPILRKEENGKYFEDLIMSEYEF